MKYWISPGLALVCAVALTSLSMSVRAEDVPYDEPIELTTEDGWKLKATYYNTRFEDANAGQQQPVVLLLPSDRGNRLNWEGQDGFAPRLRDKGFAVVTLDPRKYGESTPPANLRDPVKEVRPPDYANILRYDLEAFKYFLFEEHQQKKLNMAKLAIVAPESLAPVAMGFTVRDWKKVPHRDASTLAARTPRGQDVKGLVVLSPEVNLPGISGKRALLQLRSPAYDVAICAMAGENDEKGVEAADLTYTYITGNKEPREGEMRMFYKQIYPKFGDRGTQLVSRNDNVATELTEFLIRHIQQPPIPWQDRRSRFDRR